MQEDRPEERSDGRAPKTEEPNDPKNPPQVLLRPDVRRAALMSYLGPVIALFVIMGLALIYWANRGPAEPDPNARVDDAIGTVGRRSPGSDPAPVFGQTRDEVKYRGGDDAALTSVAEVIAARGSGRPVELDDVAIVAIENDTLRIGDGATSVRAIATRGTQGLKPGERVDVFGVTEPGDSGMQIRASQVRASR